MKKLLSILTFMAVCFVVQAQSPQIIAHRGVWKNYNVPQNSLASLKAAIDQQVWGTEFDVHLTKDDVLVVNHDLDYYGLDIATSTYEELLAIKHPNGEKIPTAEEYIKEGMKQKKTKLIYELKTNKLGKDRTIKSVELTIDLIKKLKAQKITEYIAFSYDACLKFRELDKKAKVHYLNGDKTPQQLKDARLTGFDYNVGILKKHPEWIAEAKALKLKTNVWTVNTQEDMHYFIQQNIDYITTDEPELLHQLLNK